ncbi:MAG: menaquinone reductase molybdopterin-binding-like subunit QrcB [Thermodesulfobacteriota bacterium]
MKIDRRSFLSLGLGVAAGSVLSPLPWKLTDDLSIWTQTWPWTPVPKDGAVHYVHSVSTLCSGGCGIQVRKVDDRAIKIEGLEGYPGSDGKACNQCLAGIQKLYGTDHIQTPLKRVGNRGEGRFAPISWDEAMSMVTEQLKKLRTEGKSQTLGCVVEREYGTVPQLFKRFAKAYGSPNFMTMPSYLDGYEQIFKIMQGKEAIPGFDLENADYILSFGSGLVEGWGLVPRMFQANSLWKEKGVPVVQFEPRLSNTAAKATQWIPINPGTEAILALGLAYVIIKENLFHYDFVNRYSARFEVWEDGEGTKRKGFKDLVLDRYDPRYVSRVTGVPSSKIEKIAREFAKAESPIALCGRGAGHTPGAVFEFQAVHALNGLVGNINRKGGVWALPKPDYIAWSDPELDEVAKKGGDSPRVDGAGTETYPGASSLTHRLPAVINDAEESPIQVLLVHGANPCYTLPDTPAVRAAFEKIPCIVSFASHMDETALMADLILPDHGHLEKYQDVPAPEGLSVPVIGLARPVVAPLYDTRHVGDTLIQLAKTMGGGMADSFPWKNYEECLRKTLGQHWKTMEEKGWFSPDFSGPDWNEAFETPTRNFVFIPERYGKDTEEAGISPIQVEGDPITFPLVMIPFDHIRIAAGPVGNAPFVMKTIEDTLLRDKDIFVEVHPKTAGKAGLEEGVLAVLSTPKGSAKVRVHVYDGIQPGLVAVPRGLGRGSGDEFMADKGVNVNRLIGPVEDPVSGLNAAWGIRANLTIA